mmetsp:Transcript_15755/g.35353  ORF Transcript_15755/g.35353 Transcript_15755/m.35353 type:complete len:207 (-) Transcript_15755:167-787(-)
MCNHNAGARRNTPQGVARGPLMLLCGPSGVGKSSLAVLLGAERPDELTLLSQDTFFGGGFIPYADALRCGQADMEEPAHIDWLSLREAVRAAQSDGRACLLEGHMLLTDDALVEEASLILFLDAPSKLCASRRVGRRLRREAENAEIEEYYSRFVWPAYDQYVRPVLERLREANRVIVMDANAPPSDLSHAALIAIDAALARAAER